MFLDPQHWFETFGALDSVEMISDCAESIKSVKFAISKRIAIECKIS